MKVKPFGLYVHIPYCRHRCSYCDFYSQTQFDEGVLNRLVDQLIAESISASEWLRSEGRSLPPAVSLFFGGGTPSLLPPSQMARLIRGLKQSFEINSRPEITMETNPETLTEQRLEEFLGAGISRISLGIQSFKQEHLKTLDRQVSEQANHRAIGWVKASGVPWSLDLIFGIPRQSPDRWAEDLRVAVGYRPSHLSAYQLTLKEPHPEYSNLPDEDLAVELYETLWREIFTSGYSRYEISNFSLPGFECVHNQLYWTGGDFLGIGPSASSRFFWDGRYHHRKQVADLNAYHSGNVPIFNFEKSTLEQTLIEAIFLEIRTREGIHLPSFKQRYGYDLNQAPKLASLMEASLIDSENECLRLTHKGGLLADSIAVELVRFLDF